VIRDVLDVREVFDRLSVSMLRTQRGGLHAEQFRRAFRAVDPPTSVLQRRFEILLVMF
jgi:hypothetical protein